MTRQLLAISRHQKGFNVCLQYLASILIGNRVIAGADTGEARILGASFPIRLETDLPEQR